MLSVFQARDRDSTLDRQRMLLSIFCNVQRFWLELCQRKEIANFNNLKQNMMTLKYKGCPLNDFQGNYLSTNYFQGYDKTVVNSFNQTTLFIKNIYIKNSNYNVHILKHHTVFPCSSQKKYGEVHFRLQPCISVADY